MMHTCVTGDCIEKTLPRYYTRLIIFMEYDSYRSVHMLTPREEGDSEALLEF